MFLDILNYIPKWKRAKSYDICKTLPAKCGLAEKIQVLGNLKGENSSSPKKKACDNLEASVIGDCHTFEGPFGLRRCLYLDQTASGRCVFEIEDFIRESVMPVYGNTHSTTRYFASQISAYREEARDIVKTYCDAGEEDCLIFCGSGATSAVHKLVESVIIPGDEPPIVILGPFEHHSNILPWREVTKDVITVRENESGYVDLDHLEQVLKLFSTPESKSQRIVIGSFSAGSNVTGALTDDVAVTSLLHKYGAFSFWDYAAAAPHVHIQMNPKTGKGEKCDKLARKDALFFSGHKFLGGPQTPGVLLVKKHVLRNKVPHGHGGGTVLFVTRERHQYVEDEVQRNEGGTPEIIGSIRLGLVCQMQKNFGLQNVIKREHKFTQRVLEEWGKHPEIIILGPTNPPRLPIISFLIRNLQTGYFLHHDFVVALLNDLFGIQCRSGCMCAGPYAQGLLGIDSKLAIEYETILSQPRGNFENAGVDMVFKPGFTRMSLPYHASPKEIDFAIKSVVWLAKEGFKLLPFYKMDPAKGTFRFNGREFHESNVRNKISSFSCQKKVVEPKKVSRRYMDGEECLQFAYQLVQGVVNEIIPTHELKDDSLLFLPKRLPLKWFLFPSEALEILKEFGDHPATKPNKTKVPFTPKCEFNIKDTVSSL